MLRSGIDAAATATIDDAYKACDATANTLIIQHEYGLYDRFARAHESPTASELIILAERLRNNNSRNRAAVVMHTFHPRDHVYSCINRQLLSSDIPIFHLNRLGAALHGTHYLEHGVYQADFRRARSIGGSNRRSTNFVLGSFGFLSPNKNLLGLVDALSGTGISLVANFATHNLAYADEIRQHAASRDVKLTLTTDFLSESEILDRLRHVQACISMQDPIGHFATSGSIRFLMNLRVPIICTADALQFSDLGASVVSSSLRDLGQTVVHLRDDPKLYDIARESIHGFSASNEIGLIYEALIAELSSMDASRRVAFASDDFRTPKLAVTWKVLLSEFVDFRPELLTDGEILHRLYGAMTHFMAGSDGPFRLPSIESPQALQGEDLTPSQLIERYLSNYASILEFLQSISRTSAPARNRSFDRLVSDVLKNPCDQDELLEILDTLQNVNDADRWRAIGSQFRDWFHTAAFEHTCADAPIESAIMTSLMAGKGMTLEFLNLMLPSCQDLMSEYCSVQGPPPERLAKRWPWLNSFHEWMEHNRHSHSMQSSMLSHWVYRHHFAIEEFLWTDADLFVQSCSMGLLKCSTSKFTETWSQHDDNVYSRIIFVLRCYVEATLNQGYPIALVFGLLADDVNDLWEERISKACRIGRLMISDSPRLQLASLRPRARQSSVDVPRMDQSVRTLLRKLMRRHAKASHDYAASELTETWLASHYPLLAQGYLSPVVARSFIQLYSLSGDGE
ncbi:MAG: hypothetical protein VKN13_05300 [Cyanobacteriota bacterium]|nr:hypothetical protein [Cyanobacteriota bacterium]